jgi:hypothetical protein
MNPIANPFLLLLTAGVLAALSACSDPSPAMTARINAAYHTSFPVSAIGEAGKPAPTL